jgi:GNAT superfamily N-acetyltransferase
MVFNKGDQLMSISIEFLPRSQQHSQYDWVDISSGDTRIGKARCKRNGSDGTGKATLVIYSINIYPEWAGQGYGRAFVDDCKRRFGIIIADRVRPSAIGFWETLGFRDNQDGNWIYSKESASTLR